MCSSDLTALSEQPSWTKAGWTAGGGAEAKLWRNWLGRVEYRYADYGTIGHVFFRSDRAQRATLVDESGLDRRRGCRSKTVAQLAGPCRVSLRRLRNDRPCVLQI